MNLCKLFGQYVDVALHDTSVCNYCIMVGNGCLNNCVYSVASHFCGRQISEFLMIRDCSRIPDIMWFEYTAIRKESR